MFDLGDIFQSESALVRCLSAATYNHDTQQVEINPKELTPNIVDSDRVGASQSVWHKATKIGYFDLRNNTQDRALSLWEITHKNIDVSGCGESHNTSEKITRWARYFCKAKRINIDGSTHESNEILSFSNSGYNIVKDYRQVTLPKQPRGA